jgi:hypothetical protein
VNAVPAGRDVIRDVELRRLADHRSQRRVRVLVALRQPTTARPLRRGREATSRGPLQIAVPDHWGHAEEKRAAEITGITGHMPHYLRSAGAFVTTASGDQLADIAALPWVAAIRPCRHISVPPSRTVDSER